MPAKTEKQRKFMGAELGRKRAGKKTKTRMSEKKLEEFVSKKKELTFFWKTGFLQSAAPAVRQRETAPKFACNCIAIGGVSRSPPH